MNIKKTILIISANPKDTARLRLGEEVREIEDGLSRSKHRDQFTIQTKWAVRLRDLRRTLLDFEPQIVHFCGHGEEEGLMVEDDLGNAILASPEAISGLFELFADHVECVLLNACYSKIQANAINKHIHYVIGMSKGIQDKTAIEFAVGFYDALGAGRSVDEAFKFGCNAINLHHISEHLIPILHKKSTMEFWDVFFGKMPPKKVYVVISAKSVGREHEGGRPRIDKLGHTVKVSYNEIDAFFELQSKVDDLKNNFKVIHGGVTLEQNGKEITITRCSKFLPLRGIHHHPRVIF